MSFTCKNPEIIGERYLPWARDRRNSQTRKLITHHNFTDSLDSPKSSPWNRVLAGVHLHTDILVTTRGARLLSLMEWCACNCCPPSTSCSRSLGADLMRVKLNRGVNRVGSVA